MPSSVEYTQPHNASSTIEKREVNKKEDDLRACGASLEGECAVAYRSEKYGFSFKYPSSWKSCADGAPGWNTGLETLLCLYGEGAFREPDTSNVLDFYLIVYARPYDSSIDDRSISKSSYVERIGADQQQIWQSDVVRDKSSWVVEYGDVGSVREINVPLPEKNITIVFDFSDGPYTDDFVSTRLIEDTIQFD